MEKTLDKALNPQTGNLSLGNVPHQTEPVPAGAAPLDDSSANWGQSPSLSPHFSSVNNVHSNVNVNVAMPSIHMSMQSSSLPFALRAIWFVCVGWWLSGLFIVAGYLCLLSFVLMPVGFWILNRIPQAQTLRARNRSMATEFRDGAIHFTESNAPQYPWYARLVYLVFVGWWAGLAWLWVAWFFGILILTLPLSIWMIDRTPGVITLQKH
jgi:uncharacterized membrane protein YccF (DUF307 family)